MKFPKLVLVLQINIIGKINKFTFKSFQFMENENYKKDRLVSIQNQILSMLQNEFSGDFNTIHVFDVENKENACISLHFTKVDFTSNQITLNRFYNICNTINEQNIEIISVDIIQSIDFEKKEIDFGFIISDITE